MAFNLDVASGHEIIFQVKDAFSQISDKALIRTLTQFSCTFLMLESILTNWTQAT